MLLVRLLSVAVAGGVREVQCQQLGLGMEKLTTSRAGFGALLAHPGLGFVGGASRARRNRASGSDGSAVGGKA